MMQSLPLSTTARSSWPPTMSGGISSSNPAKCPALSGVSFRTLRTTGDGGVHAVFVHNPPHNSKSKSAPSSVGKEGEQGSLAGGKTIEARRQLSYLFRAETGGLVRVSVWETQAKYVVNVEVAPLSTVDDEIVLNWVMFRFDPSVAIAQGSVQLLRSCPGHFTFTSEEQGDDNTLCVPFSQRALVANLEFDAGEAPFHLSFLFHTSAFAAAGITTHRKTDFRIPVGIGRGSPMPLGVSCSNGGSANFSIFSSKAEGVILCLYRGASKEASLEIALDPYVNRTGDIWHVSVPHCHRNYLSYGYRFRGNVLWDTGSRFHMRYVLLDPYARILRNFVPEEEEDSVSVSLTKCLGAVDQEAFFDWGGDVHPQLPTEKLVVYHLSVGLFTQHASTSRLPGNLAGTFSGLSEKLHHFKSLGVNAILLEPIFSFDRKKGPYFPYHFFSPMSTYGPDKDGSSAILSMKKMVKALHGEGIEVLLEVVFARTAEGGDAACQMITFRGIDNSAYYIVQGNVGTGDHNALNCNNPTVQRMILDSLQYWVAEFHVDGFCFVDASALLQGCDGSYLSHPPLLESIALDPLLSKTKLIADFWSPVDGSYKKVNFPHWKRWAEMNSRFCTDVGNFLRGEGLLSDLATRLCGSGDIFWDCRGPAFSFNFVGRNEFVSEIKSWNFVGEEGPGNDKVVRLRQIRNFLFILFISLGVPVLNMGDECGSSRPREPEPFDWSCLGTGFSTELVQFIAFLSSLRTRRTDLLQMKNFLKVENIEWQGSDGSQPNWKEPSSKFLAMHLKAEKDEMPSPSGKGNLFAIFNGSDFPSRATLPQLPSETNWSRLVDTALSFPEFFTNHDYPDIYTSPGLSSYELLPHSCALFEARSEL